MNPRSKTLVIDASVARAAGDASLHPDSVHAREFLKAVLDICHKMGMTPAIKEEWDKHESHYARKWRKAMVARKKLVYSDVAEDTQLRTDIDALGLSEKSKAAMVKDCHLLEAALAFDRRIVAADDIARGLFQTSAAQLPSIRGLIWVNSRLEFAKVQTWLQEGAPDLSGADIF